MSPRPTAATKPLCAAAVAAAIGLSVAGCTAAGPGDTAPKPTGSAAKSQHRVLDEQLREAYWENDVELAARLIERGADVNAKDDSLQSAYLIATSEGHLDLLDLALANGARVDDLDSWNGTGLIRAAERGHSLVLGRLLAADIDRDHVNRIGYQAIHEAVWLGADSTAYRDTVRVLVAGGAELDRPSGTEGLTPLQMAQERGYPGLEAALREALDGRETSDPDSALLGAAQAGDADQAARALRAGASIETRDPRERTPLLLAVTENQVDVARLLVAMGADPDALDDQHDTPWLVTGVTGSVSMLEALLPADPDLSILNRYGGTSLIPASERGHVDYVRRVVQTGIDLDHVNRLGWTALLETVIFGDGGPDQQEIVRALLTAGADPSIPDGEGISAREHAEDRGHTDIVQLLETP